MVKVYVKNNSVGPIYLKNNSAGPGYVKNNSAGPGYLKKILLVPSAGPGCVCVTVRENRL